MTGEEFSRLAFQWLGANVFSSAIFIAAVAFFGRTYFKAKIEEGIKQGNAEHLETLKSELTAKLEYSKSELNSKLEELKYTLKNSELLFSRRIVALTELRRFFRKLVPRPSTPDSDWTEACEFIANNATSTLDWLDEYLGTHEAVLPVDVAGKLNDAVSSATDVRFGFEWDASREDAIATTDAIKNADRIYNLMFAAIKDLQSNINTHFKEVSGRTGEFRGP